MTPPIPASGYSITGAETEQFYYRKLQAFVAKSAPPNGVRSIGLFPIFKAP